MSERQELRDADGRLLRVVESQGESIEATVPVAVSATPAPTNAQTYPAPPARCVPPDGHWHRRVLDSTHGTAKTYRCQTDGCDWTVTEDFMAPPSAYGKAR